ncbi:MAG: peptidylprolyl isomerase, partial [Bacteroidetes bacterium]|nr:peptidylprolyl isomerase [Bacteroidota bacterium]
MKKISCISIFAFLSIFVFSSVKAQSDDPVLINISGTKITKSDFVNVYKKNNVKNETLDKKSLEEYLDLYINFKLKVKEAEEIGLDTATSFKTELAGYRKQLAQPYLIDKDVSEKLLLEAYDRMKYDVRASHILIKCDANALPKDTLVAYNRVMGLRKRIMAGESFEKIAVEASEDPSARDQAETKDRPANKGNAGDLGYFSSLDMVYPFESGAYNTKIGEISMPIRSNFGYHLIKAVDKRKAMGKVQVAHIFVVIPKNSTHADSLKYKSKIEEISAKLKAGENYEELAKTYSDDKGSATKGGVLPWFGVNRMVPEFIVAVSKLQNKNDISDPVQTVYGWHIIKMLDRKDIGSFDEVKGDLKSKIAKDGRSAKSKDAIIAKIKKENKFTETANAKADLYKVVDEKVFEGKWDVTKAKDMKKPMFVLGTKTFTQEDFSKFIAANQSSRTKAEIEAYVNEMYSQFVKESCINYEDSRLEQKYPEFRALMNEYRDGILLFELTDKKVWSKAVKDTVGLLDFYTKNKANYTWPERVEATVYTCSNAQVSNETREFLAKNKGKEVADQDLLNAINKDSQLKLQIENGKYAKGDNKSVDAV